LCQVPWFFHYFPLSLSRGRGYLLPCSLWNLKSCSCSFLCRPDVPGFHFPAPPHPFGLPKRLGARALHFDKFTPSVDPLFSFPFKGSFEPDALWTSDLELNKAPLPNKVSSFFPFFALSSSRNLFFLAVCGLPGPCPPFLPDFEQVVTQFHRSFFSVQLIWTLFHVFPPFVHKHHISGFHRLPGLESFFSDITRQPGRLLNPSFGSPHPFFAPPSFIPSFFL